MVLVHFSIPERRAFNVFFKRVDFSSSVAASVERYFKDQIRHNGICAHADAHDQIMQVADRAAAQDQPGLAAQIDQWRRSHQPQVDLAVITQWDGHGGI